LQNQSAAAFQFGDFVLSETPLELSKNGTPVDLPLQSLKLLLLLVKRRGALASHDDLRTYLWGDRTVNFNQSIYANINHIRHALEDDSENPKLIENVRRQGYRFLGDVERVSKQRIPSTARKSISKGVMGRNLAIGASILIGVTAIAVFLPFNAPTPSIDITSAGQDAQSLYQRGQYLIGRHDLEATKKGLDYFDAALQSDPNSGQIHLSAAKAHGRLGNFEQADWHANRALELDDKLVDAHVVLGLVELLHRWDWESAKVQFRQALMRDDSNAAAHQGLATYYVLQGNLEEGLRHMEQALELDPASTLIRADFGWFNYFAGDYEKAADLCAEALDLAPGDAANLQCLIRSASLAGDYDTAIGRMIVFMKKQGATGDDINVLISKPPSDALLEFDRWRLNHYQRSGGADMHDSAKMAFTAASVGQFEVALGYVEQGLRERNPMIAFVAVDLVFAPLHGHPKFEAAMQELDLERL